MGGEWIRSTLGEIATEDGYGLVDGPFGSNLPASAYTGEGIPVIRGSNLSLGVSRFKADEFVFVSAETAERLHRSLCKKNDIVFTKKGTLGQTGLIPEDGPFDRYLLSSNQMKLTVDKNKSDPKFVYYVVSSQKSISKIRQDAEQTGVPKTNVKYLKSFPILLPPLVEQRAIAHILGSLDDKIELNRQLNKTLEQMAQTIFKSWFIDFDPVTFNAVQAGNPVPERFQATAERYRQNPDIQTLPQHILDLFPNRFEDSELGEIPVGWESSTLGAVMRHPRRTAKPSDMDPQTPYIGLEHMPQRSITLGSWGHVGAVNSNKHQFMRGEILFGKLRPYFHKVGIAPVDGVCSTDIVVVEPATTEWFGFVLGHISSKAFVDHTTSASTGTRMPRTNWKDMCSFGVALPDTTLASAFTKSVRPFFDRLLASIPESADLSATRDTLLPKLISGELRVLEPENCSSEVT